MAVNLEHIVNRRTEELHSSTRSEIFMSIGAAVLLVAVMAWRFAPAYDQLQEAGFAAILVWVAISLYRFRHGFQRTEAGAADGVAATGLEFYRKELERRRDHLRNEWLWHGPLVLACVLLVATMWRRNGLGFDRLASAVPLIVVLVAWTGFGLRRRLLQARDLQREIDEIR
jgi:hypothetical protein